MEGTEGEICLPLLSFDGKRTQTVLEKLTATAVELCVSVRGAARLMAMHYGMVRVCCGVGTPSPCVPVRVDCGRYTLLWRGVGDEILDDTEYTPCPQASVSALLRENAEREIESAGASTPLDELEAAASEGHDEMCAVTAEEVHTCGVGGRRHTPFR